MVGNIHEKNIRRIPAVIKELCFILLSSGAEIFISKTSLIMSGLAALQLKIVYKQRAAEMQLSAAKSAV